MRLNGYTSVGMTQTPTAKTDLALKQNLLKNSEGLAVKEEGGQDSGDTERA